VTSRLRFYDSIARTFDAVMNPYDLARRIDVVFDRLLDGRVLTGVRLLDVGCGTGPFSLAAQQRGADVVSVDLGLELLRVAREKGTRRPVVADAGVLPFPDGSFDVVISSECIEHTADPERSVGEMLRVLQHGGTLALTCPNRLWRWSAVAASAINLRPYHGLENWPGWWALERWTHARHGVVTQHVGVHLFPFVLPFTWPLLRRLDRFGSKLGPAYVNQAIAVVKMDRANQTN
jgi:SAM-dependent methyltransferase